jgi:hypothetical protein
MPNKIILKKSSVASKVPLATDLEIGEIAVNLVDQKLYSKNASGTVVLVGNAAQGTVTSVTGTSPVASSGGATPAISLASGYGDTQNPYASKTAKHFLAAPNAANGVPSFRAIVASDIPTLNQNTTGSAATLTTTRTLWGQNFNGSANVTGALSSVTTIGMSGQLTNTVATGTAPFVISSTTRVSNLNAATAGAADTATTLATARTINGTSFNGSANITTASWGTARTLTFGSTGKSVNGSANVSWSLAEIGAAAASHDHAGLLHRNSSVNDANTALTEGTYGFGAGSGLLNYPWASGYGKLVVTVNDGGTHNNSNNWIWQVINDTSGRRYSRYKVNAGGWTAWALESTGGTWNGNAATATALQTGRIINGTSFNGSADITTANWGTARTITLGSTGKSVNGSANVSWTLAEIGAARAGAAGSIVETPNTISANYTMTTGSNGMSAGPMSIANGVTVTVPNGSTWVIV